MANVVSKIGTNMAYVAGKTRVVIRRGNNDVPDSLVAALKEKDAHFAKHLEAGHLVLASAPEAKPEPEKADPRVRLPKESDKAYNARMKKLDDEEAAAADKAKEDAAFLVTYDALSEEDRATMYPTLDAREKALVDGPRPE